ncbi:M23 family metallopeptidase [Rhodococcus sp. EPR-157]|uniref:M23 family metallopeptidase n=1 Tax=Rhodococcus sp. EPR-157 TaxID=1813677 RepID=UPI000AAFE67D|nr:M23 family metallopeptidase [Rhodococcus sp. EPR-157]
MDSARVGHPTSVESATQYALAVPGSTAENMPSLSSGPDPAGVGAGEVPHDDTEMSAIEGGSRRNRRGIHRRRVPKPGGRAIAASVAVGAFLSAAASSPNAGSDEAVALSAASIDQPPGVVPPSPTVAAPPQILQLPDLDVGRLAQQWTEQLAEGRARAAERAARDAEARRPLSAVPVSGTLTSNYGARWGTTHYGLDIANTIGTPIVSVTDGEVIEAGPAQGFGLWVRIRQDDGTIGVYGHIDQALVTAGQRVKAGELIATVGNRGQSTGPHLHYEVWQSDGAKSDPTAWLSARGIDIT